MRLPDFSQLPEGAKPRPLFLISLSLFLVALLIPDLGPFWAKRDLERGKHEDAFRYIREGRRSSAYEEIFPYLLDSNRRTRERAVRELSRLEDPRSIRPIFETHRRGLIDHDQLVDAIARQSNPVVIPILVLEMDSLSTHTQTRIESATRELREEYERLRTPPRIEALTLLHIDILVADQEPEVQGDFR